MCDISGIVNLIHQHAQLVLYFVIAWLSHMAYNYSMKLTNDIAVASARVYHLELAIKNVQQELVRKSSTLQRLQNDVDKLKLELELQRKDMTGLVDYAYGGKVIATENTLTLNEGNGMLFGACVNPKLEQRMLESSVLPGNCWPIIGSQGSAEIKLIKSIVITHVTLEHAPRELLPHGTNYTVPKEFSVRGVDHDGQPGHSFGKFTYNIDGPDVQTFPVLKSSETMFERVKFQLLSNHGSDRYTCIYRLRIHGH